MCTAVIGVGRWGQNLARNFYELGSLSALCDTDPKKLAPFRVKYPHLFYTTCPSDILQNKSLTQMVIATPTPTHFEWAKKGLLAGKDVLVEKPVCVESADAEELIALANRGKQILMVGHLLLYHGAFLHIQKLLTQGVLGKLLHISTKRISLGTGTQEENVLWDLAPHDLSLILELCDEQSVSDLTCTGSERAAQVKVRFSEGLTAQMEVAFDRYCKEQKVALIGTKGQLMFDDTKKWEEKITLFGKALRLPQLEPLKEECQAFLTACKTRKSPKTDGKQALKVTRLIQQANGGRPAEVF